MLGYARHRRDHRAHIVPRPADAPAHRLVARSLPGVGDTGAIPEEQHVDATAFGNARDFLVDIEVGIGPSGPRPRHPPAPVQVGVRDVERQVYFFGHVFRSSNGGKASELNQTQQNTWTSRRHSIRRLASFTTAPHLTRSDRAKRANSSGDMGKGSPPTFCRAVTSSGCRKIRFTSAASSSTIGRGVPAGANRPCQPMASKPGTVSPIVGRAGAVATRRGVVTASGRTSPAFAIGQIVVMLSIARSMWPATLPAISSAVPRNGMWIMVTPIAFMNMMVERCPDVPLPADP